LNQRYCAILVLDREIHVKRDTETVFVNWDMDEHNHDAVVVAERHRQIHQLTRALEGEFKSTGECLMLELDYGRAEVGQREDVCVYTSGNERGEDSLRLQSQNACGVSLAHASGVQIHHDLMLYEALGHFPECGDGVVDDFEVFLGPCNVQFQVFLLVQLFLLL